MEKTGKEIYSSSPDLLIIGRWATIWWGVSCGYVLLWVWLSRHFYVHSISPPAHTSFFPAWRSALSLEYSDSAALQVLLFFILLIWVVLAISWLRALKRNKIPYKTALKDLFLTIRK